MPPENTSDPQSSAKPKAVQVIAISSGKGGVGKTNIAVNLAIAMAASGRRPLLLDADLGLANVDVLLGLHSKLSLLDVIAGRCNVEDTLLHGPRGVMVVPASSGIKRMTELSAAEHAGVITAFNGLSSRFDSLLIDTGAGIADNVIVYARAAQEVVVVVCDEPTSIADAYALIKVLHRDYGVQRFRILVNRAESAEHGRGLFEQLLRIINRFLNLTPDYMGCIPEDPYLQKAIRKQKAVVDAWPLSKSAVAFDKLARDIASWPRVETASGYLEFFVESITSQGSDTALSAGRQGHAPAHAGDQTPTRQGFLSPPAPAASAGQPSTSFS